MRSGNEGFSPLTPGTVSELRSICDLSRVLSGDEASISRYGRDQVADARYARSPEVVVLPENAAEVQEILRLATRYRIPVTPRGAGSGLSGGAVPLYGGISISFERMNRVIEIDTSNLVAVVEPGVVTNELDSRLAEYGLFFAGYPLSEEFCFIGGNVAENAGGGRAVKYGVTSRYVTGLEIVTAAGDIMQIGGKRFKDVTGLDLLSLLTGSEGTLAVFTKIFLRILPRPTEKVVASIEFPDEIEALKLVPRILADRTILPSAVEFLDSVCLFQTRAFLGEAVGDRDTSILLVELDGDEPESFDRRIERLEAHLADCAAESSVVDFSVARGEVEIGALWKIRKQVPWALKKLNPVLTAEDIVVPVGRSAELLQAVRDISDRRGVLIPFFGHAGDGNYHASPMKPEGLDVEAWDAILKSLLTDLYTRASSLGGTISGEHGIGHKRIGYLPLVLDETQRALLKRIKYAFDPEGILNPGKLYG